MLTNLFTFFFFHLCFSFLKRFPAITQSLHNRKARSCIHLYCGSGSNFNKPISLSFTSACNKKQNSTLVIFFLENRFAFSYDLCLLCFKSLLILFLFCFPLSFVCYYFVYGFLLFAFFAEWNTINHDIMLRVKLRFCEGIWPFAKYFRSRYLFIHVCKF